MPLAPTGRALRFPTRKVRALFAYLLANATQSHGRDKLAALLWDDHAEAAGARESAQGARRACARACRTRHGTALPSPPARSRSGRRGSRSTSCGSSGSSPTARRRPWSGRSASIADHCCEGFAACGEEFDDWLCTERRRLDEMLQQALQRLLEHYVVTGAIDRAIQVALRLLASDPLQESVHRSLIRLYMYQDRVGAALDQYRRCRELLARELGVEPAPETESLRAELLKLPPPRRQAIRGCPGVSRTMCPSAPW